MRLNGIGGRLLRGVKSLYVGSKACVRVGIEVRVGLRQGCVMSLWLFNLYIDGVVSRHGLIVICNSNRLLRGFSVIEIDEANHSCNSNSISNRRQSNGK